MNASARDTAGDAHPLVSRPQSAGPRIPVVLAESGATYGGTEKVVSELALRLDRTRFQPWAVLSPGRALDRMAADLERGGVPVIRLAEITNRWQLGRLARTWGLLARHRQAVWHVHHVWPAADRYLVPLAHLVGVTAVIVTEHLVGFAHSNAQRWLKRRELARADQVVCVSRAVAAALERDYDFDGARGRVIENGVDARGLSRETSRAREERARLRTRFGVHEDEFVWLFVGRLERQKGIDVLIEAFARAHPTRGRLWIVGDGSERRSLEARAEQLSVLSRVHFEGAVHDASAFYWSADGFGLASRWEGLPLALLEAQAAGLPVVAAVAGGVAEAVRDGTSGLLVPSEDVEAFARAMTRVSAEPGLAQRLAHEAARQAREEWSWERMVSAYEVLYERVWRAGARAPFGRHQEGGS